MVDKLDAESGQLSTARAVPDGSLAAEDARSDAAEKLSGLNLEVTTSVAHRDGIAVLSVGGEIDAFSAPELESAIAEVLGDNPPVLIIDLSGVDFLASAGLRILAKTQEQMMTGLGRFAVVASAVIRRPIQITGLSTMLSLYSTLDDAIAGVRDVSR